MRPWNIAQPLSWSSWIGWSVAFIGILSAALSSVCAAAAATDIHAAIRAGDAEMVQIASKDGAESNRPDSWGWTPLIVALQQSKAPLVAMLINHGASVTATDARGRTPLLVAAQLKNTAAIRRCWKNNPM
jgi:ankyrin repeat protein